LGISLMAAILRLAVAIELELSTAYEQLLCN
jgi:hypothetical protein